MKIEGIDVKIEGIDPRSATYESDAPAYWVIFWSQPPRPPDVPADVLIGYHSDEFRISGATDVFDVVRWADSDTDGRDYTLYCEVIENDGAVTIARLAGNDPTRGGDPGSESTFEVGSSTVG